MTGRSTVQPSLWDHGERGGAGADFRTTSSSPSRDKPGRHPGATPRVRELYRPRGNNRNQSAQRRRQPDLFRPEFPSRAASVEGGRWPMNDVLRGRRAALRTAGPRALARTACANGRERQLATPAHSE